MIITCVYSDANGDSRFEDIDIQLENQGAIGYLSASIPVTGMILRQVPPDYDYDFHNAPQRQYIMLLDGGIIIETSLGEKRVFPTGAVLLVEDTEGKGHRSQNLEQRVRTSAFITI